MPRPIRNRKISTPPKMTGFKPFGIPVCKLSVVKLHFDEYESLRLVGYLDLPQDEAAERMEVSRPTLTRIYNSAIKKIARAMIEGAAIEIEGGQVEFEGEWFKCKKCHNLIMGINNHKRCEGCKSFGQSELVGFGK
ncbi:MAG: DUF134 domain-containing protein [Bacteroidota bacterium]|nr:DUF134 domain-containing protein [Bacteroidota bacterium]